jgi:hypothetical protein
MSIFGEATNDARGGNKSDEVAHGRSGGCLPSAGSSGVEGEPDHAKQPIEQLAGGTAFRPEGGAGEQDGQSLSRDWHWGESEGDTYLGGYGCQQGECADEHRFASPQGATLH